MFILVSSYIMYMYICISVKYIKKLISYIWNFVYPVYFNTKYTGYTIFFIIFDSPRHWGGQVGARGEDGAQGVEA